MTADLVSTALWRSWIWFFHSIASQSVFLNLIHLSGSPDRVTLSQSVVTHLPHHCTMVRSLRRLFFIPGQFKPGQWPGAVWQPRDTECYSYVTRHTGQLSPDLKQWPGTQHPTPHMPHTIPGPSQLSKQTQFASCPPTEQFHSLQRRPQLGEIFASLCQAIDSKATLYQLNSKRSIGIYVDSIDLFRKCL